MATEPPLNVGNVSGYIRDMIGQGLSARAALAEYRQFGGAIRDSRWYALYGQVTDTIAREPSFLAINPYQLPAASEYGTAAMGAGGQYATQVKMSVLDRATGAMLTKQATYITDQPHTGVEAEAWAQQQFGNTESEADYGNTVLGALASDYWVTVPYGSQ